MIAQDVMNNGGPVSKIANIYICLIKCRFETKKMKANIYISLCVYQESTVGEKLQEREEKFSILFYGFKILLNVIP